MPDQEELVHKVAQSSNVSVGDMISAFDQTRVDPRDEKYATIINHMGIMQQRTIQQGDKNAVATQQRTMQHHLREHWGKNVTVYVDDIPIYDEKPDMSAYSHYLACRRILLTLRKYKFYLNRKKTKFLPGGKRSRVLFIAASAWTNDFSSFEWQASAELVSRQLRFRITLVPREDAVMPAPATPVPGLDFLRARVGF
jgi:hypothetical protein